MPGSSGPVRGGGRACPLPRLADARGRDVPFVGAVGRRRLICSYFFSLPRQVHAYRGVARPPIALERIESVREVSFYAASLLFADLSPGDSEDAPVFLVPGDRDLVAMACQAVSDRLPLADVDGRLAGSGGLLGPDDIDASLGQRVTIQVELEKVAPMAVVAASPSRQRER